MGLWYETSIAIFKKSNTKYFHQMTDASLYEYYLTTLVFNFLQLIHAAISTTTQHSNEIQRSLH